MKKITLFIIVFSLLNVKIASQSKGAISNFSCLEGSWESISDKFNIYETWERLNDQVMAGKSFTIKDGDTISYESMRIEIIDKDIYFIPTVRDQNEGKPVLFKLIEFDDEVVFENKDHDFPQRVIYSCNGADSLNARIEGEQNGMFRKVAFNYKRKPGE